MGIFASSSGFFARVEEFGNGSILVAGLCDVEGASKAANRIYDVAGTTVSGQRWYASSGRIQAFNTQGDGLDSGYGAPDDEGASFPLVLALAVGTILNVLSMYHWRRRFRAAAQQPPPPLRNTWEQFLMFAFCNS